MEGPTGIQLTQEPENLMFRLSALLLCRESVLEVLQILLPR